MKTIIHLVLSDEERGHLARALGTSGLVSRSQVTELVNNYIKEKLNGRAVDESPPETGGCTIRQDIRSELRDEAEGGRDACEGTSYLEPRDSDTDLKRVCKQILHHIELGKDDGLVNTGWIESIIKATGVQG